MWERLSLSIQPILHTFKAEDPKNIDLTVYPFPPTSNLQRTAFSVCIPRDFYVTNATVDRNILLWFRSENKGNFFLFLHHF